MKRSRLMYVFKARSFYRSNKKAATPEKEVEASTPQTPSDITSFFGIIPVKSNHITWMKEFNHENSILDGYIRYGAPQ